MIFGILLACQAVSAESLLPPARHGVYVVAHRGAHDGIPENTLAAYAKAIELGCDFVEVDVRTTKDGELVSIHNDTVDAYTQGTTGKVRDFTLAELKSLDIGSRVGPEWSGERIPEMREVLALCLGKIGLYLDVKQADTAKLLALVREHGMERACLWYAGPKQLREVAAQCPECIPMPDPGPEKFLERALTGFRPQVVASTLDNFSPTFAQACHAAGAMVIVDDEGPETWSNLLTWKADGIQTDHPAALIEALKAGQK